MKTLKTFLIENTTSANWVKPDDASVKHEYNVEYKNHHSHSGFYKSHEEFADAVKKAKVLKVTPDIDRSIGGRSHTRNFDELHDLIKGYASYPQYRNEKTLKDLSDRIKTGKSVHYPILLHHGKGRYTVMGGNTRADLAMQHHGHYHALVLEPAKNGK
jgi:hypothetical protein